MYVFDKFTKNFFIFNRSGFYKFKFGGAAQGNGNFTEPTALDFDSDDNVYILDNQRKIVQKFDRRGRYKKKFGSFRRSDTPFADLKQLFIDGNDHIYIVDDYYKRLAVFDRSGQFISRINYPAGLLDAKIINIYKNDIYIIDQTTKKVLRYKIN